MLNSTGRRGTQPLSSSSRLFGKLSTILCVLLASNLYSATTVFAQTFVAQRFEKGVNWPAQKGCSDLQLNITAQSYLVDNTLYLVTNINDLRVANKSDQNLAVQVLVGVVDLTNSFTTLDYAVQWWTSPNFSFQFQFAAATSEKLIFSGEQRSTPGARNVSQSLITFTTTPHTLETIPWPSVIKSGNTGEKLPLRGPVIQVPSRGLTFYTGPPPSSLSQNFDVELFTYDIKDGSMNRGAAPNRNFASGAYVPIGKEGVLVMLAGEDRDDGSAILNDHVMLYDINTSTWFRQPVTGQSPPPRVYACATVVSAQDGSSHQIHMYGGNRAGSSEDMSPSVDNHYILSLPSFTWIKAPSTANPRTWANCDLIGEHTMLVSAGFQDSTDCVELLEAVDLNTLNVTTNIKNAGGYEVPDVVRAVIGGGPTGPATLTAPSAGFASGLSSILSQSYIYATSTSTSTPTPSNSSKSSTPIAPIVGGSIGGVAVLAIGVFIFFFIKKRKSPSPPSADAAAAATGGEAGAWGGVEAGDGARRQNSEKASYSGSNQQPAQEIDGMGVVQHQQQPGSPPPPRYPVGGDGSGEVVYEMPAEGGGSSGRR